MENMESTLKQAIDNAKAKAAFRSKVHRFDIFKGVEDSTGKVQKLRSVGSAQLVEGAKTYAVYLKSLLKDVFYLMPEEKRLTRGDYVILTRENSQTPGRKYYWNNVGEAFLMSDINVGLMRLDWDLFGVRDIYMNLYPVERVGQAPSSETEAA